MAMAPCISERPSTCAQRAVMAERGTQRSCVIDTGAALGRAASMPALTPWMGSNSWHDCC
jgi:hypothetical protein